MDESTTSWLDDTGDWFASLWDSTTDVVGGFVDTTAQAATSYYNDWLSDSLGDSGSPENSVETAQGRNADVSNSPGVVFGLSQNQLLIGAALVVGAAYLVRRK